MLKNRAPLLRNTTITSPLHHHYITITSPLHRRYITITSPLDSDCSGVNNDNYKTMPDNRCMYFSSIPRSWFYARQSCYAMQGHIITVDSDVVSFNTYTCIRVCVCVCECI